MGFGEKMLSAIGIEHNKKDIDDVTNKVSHEDGVHGGTITYDKGLDEDPKLDDELKLERDLEVMKLEEDMATNESAHKTLSNEDLFGIQTEDHDNQNNAVNSKEVKQEELKISKDHGSEGITPKKSEEGSNKADIAAVLVKNVEEIGNDAEITETPNEETKAIEKSENDTKIGEIKAEDIVTTKEAANKEQFEQKKIAKIYKSAADHTGRLRQNNDSVRESETGSKIAKRSQMTSLLLSIVEQGEIAKELAIDNVDVAVNHVAKKGEKATNDDSISHLLFPEHKDVA